MLTIHKASDKVDSTDTRTIGLAIAGGGPVGAVYELGALRALEDSIDRLRLHELDVYVGVSAGAFIAAALANRIPCRELCGIFMGLEHTELRFVPEHFLRPAYREYFHRATRLPGILRDALLDLMRHPGTISVAELIGELGKALPSGIYDNEAIHRFLKESFELRGRGDHFDDLDCELYLVAVDLDSGAAVRFGSDGNRDIPISRAVQASAALPGLYPPVRIGDRYYVDGALRRTLHASVALDRGVDLLLGINPLVPYDSSTNERAPHLKARTLIDGGLPLILSQTFRALIQSRMKIGFRKYRTSHAFADLLLLEPDRDDEEIFFTNIFSYASRIALCEHAFQATRRELRARAAELTPLLQPYGMSIREEFLMDQERTLTDSIDHVLQSHARVSRKLARTLETLEDSLRSAR